MTLTTNTCIVVTGASRGIGAAIAAALAEDGQTVACLSRSASLPEVEGLTVETRSRFVTGACDVTDSDSIRNAIAKIADAGPHDRRAREQCGRPS